MTYLNNLQDTAECYGYTVQDAGEEFGKTRFRVLKHGRVVYQVPALMLIEGWLDGVAHTVD